MEENKNLLFIGDLTTANNYGAIATSESLKKLIEQRFKNVKYIDYWSLFKPTPLQGRNANKSVQETTLDLMKKMKKVWPFSIIYNFIPNVAGYVYQKVENIKDLYHRDIPYLFEQYDECCEKMLRGEILEYEYELVKWSDIVYINGEGSFVHGTDQYGKYRPAALYMLFLVYFAKKYMSKYCAIVNHTVDPDNQDAIKIIKNVYPGLDYITVREPFSEANLNSWGINNVRLVPDALFTFTNEENWSPSEEIKNEIDFSKPYICLGDGSGIKSKYHQVKWDVYYVYCELIDKLKNIVPQIVFIDGFTEHHQDINKVIKHNNLGRINLNNCSYKDLYQVLKKGEIFISGRYHSSILSVISGTPILLWGADSYKTKGLYRLLDYPYKFFEIDTIPVHIDDIVIETKKILNKRKEIEKKLLQKAQLLRDLSYNNVIFEGY